MTHRSLLVFPALLALVAPLAAAPPLLQPPSAQEPAVEARRDADPLAALLPRDATFVLRFSSAAAAEELVRGLLGLVRSPSAGSWSAQQWLEGNPAVARALPELDRERPFALAWTAAGKGMPRRSYLLPFRGEPELAAVGPGGVAPTRADDYLGIHTGPGYEPAGPGGGLGAGLPEGAVSGRMDVAAHLAPFRPIIEMQLNAFQAQAAGQSGALGEAYVDGIRALLGATETIEFAAGLRGGRLEGSAALTLREDSELARIGSGGPPLAGMKRYLDPDASFQLAVSIDFARWSDPLLNISRQMFAGLPAGAWMERAAALFEHSGALSVAWGEIEAGMRTASYFRPADAAAFARDYRALLEQAASGAGLGFATVSAAGTRAIAGVTVHEFRLHLNREAFQALLENQGAAWMPGMGDLLEAIYGGDEVRLALAASDEAVVLVQGGDDAFLARAVARLSAPEAALPPDLERALQACAGHGPALAMRCDLTPFLHLVSTAMGLPMAETIEGHGAAITLHGHADGRVWRAGGSFDLREMSEFLHAVLGAFGPGGPGPGPDEEY